jgi:hypothetical protein
MIYQVTDKNNVNLNRALMGRFQRFLDDCLLKEIPLHGRKFHGQMKGLLQLLYNLIGYSVVMIGKNSFLIRACKVHPHGCRAIVLLFSALMSKPIRRGIFTLKVTGPNCRVSLRLSAITGMLRFPLLALLRLYS